MNRQFLSETLDESWDEGVNIVREEKRSKNWALRLSFSITLFPQLSSRVPCAAAVPSLGIPPSHLPAPCTQCHHWPLQLAFLSLPRMIWGPKDEEGK